MKLLKMEIERLISEIKNYRLDNIVGLADVFLLCLGIFLGTGRDIFPESSLAYALLGMILWRYAALCLGTACSIVQREIRLGTLEQLMMARYPLMEVVVIRLLAAMLVETVKLAAVSALLVVIFRIPLDWEASPWLTAASVVLCLGGTVGMGCFVAGVALVYKRANALVNSLSYFTLFFTGLILPLEILPAGFSYAAALFPFRWCVEIIRGNGAQAGFGGLLAASLLWLAVGALSFSRAMGRTMACGTTAQY